MSRLAHASSDGKQALRQEVWSRLEAAGAALFPGARGRIPNFRGAAAAADLLAATEAWRDARVVKCNPDSPQRGERVGKGGGYSDLEYAIGREVGCIDEATRVACGWRPRVEGASRCAAGVRAIAPR